MPSRQAGEVDPDQRKTSSMRDGPRRRLADQQTYTGMGDGVGCALNGGKSRSARRIRSVYIIVCFRTR